MSVTGTAVPLSCPPGTYSGDPGLRTLFDCRDCEGGFYCPDYNMTEYGPACNPGKAHVST